ncbi:hypothetical protein KEH51_02060 [[Brevibacterium] frigoritolerans]|uniref:Uncharacterized protein n=1 Tax=Peribacillus frigoritolerans TaxID=450367 RepID=A0A941FM09_9BACI|nr:hypothetical protein [Peribacillus frigoritolerans]
MNKDVKAEYEGKTLTVGNELVEQLKDNDDLEWHFVTEKAAKKGSMMVHIIWSSPFRRTFQKCFYRHG